MKRLKLVSDKVIKNGETFVYNRRIIEYDPEANKSPEQRYFAKNVEQFYDWINPNKGETEK